MRRSLFAVSLGLLAAVVPAVPAAGQSWLPSWAKLTGKKESTPTATAAPNSGPNFGASTYTPSPYATSPYGPWSSGATAQPAGAPNPSGPNLAGPALGGNTSPTASPAAFQTATPADAAPPQVNLGTPSSYGSLNNPVPTPIPTTAPALVSPVPPSTYGDRSVSSAGRDPALPSYTPSPAGTGPAPPLPMTGPGIASTPRLPPVGLPGYSGARSALNYGSLNAPSASPAPNGSAVFDSAPPSYPQPGAGSYAPPAGPSYGTPSYGASAYAPPSYGAPSYGSPYAPSYGGSGGCDPGQAYSPYGGSPSQISSCAAPYCPWEQVTAFYEYGAFKGPLDLNGLNGNFGNRVGLFGAVPVYAPLGIAAQLGGSYGWYDWKGTQFTGSGNREQNFLTAGGFQRTSFGLNYGATYDWLLDHYYSKFHFEQVRAAVSYNLNPQNEVGVWAAIPTRKDSATIGTPPVNNTFAPVMQGNVYWRRVWNSIATTNSFMGWCEEPNDFSCGSSAQFALNSFVAVNGGFQYIWPGSGGNTGRQEEIWNMSFGLVFYPGSAMTAATSPFRPLLAMPDNGNFAVRRY